MDRIGERLRAARLRAGLTQEALARHLKVARNTIIRAEKDQHATSFATIARWADICGVSLADIVSERVDEAQTEPQ